LLFFLFYNFYTIQAKDFPIDPINTYDEVTVEITVKGYQPFESDVIITDTHAVYVHVAGLFKNLGVYCISEKKGNSLKGFIENENRQYQIDYNTKQINSGNNTIKSINGIVKVLGDIYIETRLMNEAFGLNMLFNFRSLSIKLEANFELPFIKQARLEKIRQNLSNLHDKNEVAIDTVIGRNYHLFNGATMDWSMSSYQSQGKQSTKQFSLGIGSEIAYGEAKIGMIFHNQSNFDKRQLYYNWRWIDNDNNFIKQAQLGKVGTPSIAFLGASLLGASFNNSPNTVRKAKGTYTISEYTEPNWTVELYINDALVDYTMADASGLYIFNIPIVYGYNKLTLKTYGPLGEERIEERQMNTPYTFMPVKVMEYNVSGGFLENEDSSKFGRGELNYGLSRFVTIGGGVEYLSSIPNTPFIPFANLAFQPFSKMVINIQYAHDVHIKGGLHYNFAQSASVTLDYSKYKEGQQATLNSTLEERKVRLSLPFKIGKIRYNTKLSYTQLIYDSFNLNRLNAVFSGRYKNFSTNASLASNWNIDQKPFMTSTIIFSQRMRNGFIIRPTFHYDISENKIMSFRTEIEKRVAKISLAASYERNVHYGTNNASLSFKYELPYGRIGLSSTYRNNKLDFSENAQGSVAFGGNNGKLKTGYNSAIGRGGVLLYPFLDLNQNGSKDKGEQMVLLNNVKITGGKAVISKQDSIVRISDLNAFINYNVRFSDADLDNISLKFKHKTYQILVDPNQYKKVAVPILVMGEINGMVLLNKNATVNGQGRIRIHIKNEKGDKVAETLSESDGYFSYLGLKPGAYNICIDENQLKNIGYQTSKPMHKVVLKQLVDGDIIEGLDFEIKKRKTVISDKNALDKAIFDFAKNTNIASTFRKISAITTPFYSVQIGVYNNKVTLEQLLNLTPIYYEVLPDKTTRYITGVYLTKTAAKRAKNKIIGLGIKDAYVVAYRNGKKVDVN